MQQPQTNQPQVVTVAGPLFGNRPVTMMCPNCQKTITTKTFSEHGALTWISAGVLCFVMCCCIPFCVDSCDDVTHTCPSCNITLGLHKPGCC